MYSASRQLSLTH